jgi:hypothetical protein
LEDEAKSLAGNALLRHLLDHRTEIETAISTWQARTKLKNERLARWRIAEHFAGDAETIPEMGGALLEIKSIRDGRHLLELQDPLPEPMSRVRQILVERVTGAHKSLTLHVRRALDELDGIASWSALTLAQKGKILEEVNLSVPTPIDTSSDGALADTLDRRPLRFWQSETDAVSGRAARAAEKAAKLSEPTIQTIHVERATLRTADDIEAWLSRQRDRLLAAIGRGPVLVG